MNKTSHHQKEKQFLSILMTVVPILLFIPWSTFCSVQNAMSLGVHVVLTKKHSLLFALPVCRKGAVLLLGPKVTGEYAMTFNC